MVRRSLLPSIWRKSDTPSVRESDHPFHFLQREMNRVFDSFFRDVDVAPFGGWDERMKAFSPSVDVKEDEMGILVKAELPGVEEKDVEVLLSDNVLTLKGEKKEEKEEKEKDYYHMERSYGSFSRVISLPEGVDPEKAEASYKNGVLTIRLPRKKEAAEKGRKIPIKTE